MHPERRRAGHGGLPLTRPRTTPGITGPTRRWNIGFPARWCREARAEFADRIVYFRGGDYTPIGQDGNENIRLGAARTDYLGTHGAEVH